MNGTVTLVAGLVSIPIFQGLANRIGKTKTLGITIALVMLGSLASWFTMTPAHPYLSFAGGILNAPGYTGLWMLLPSMLADVADHDELQTSERREGSFSSIFGWLLKLSSTLGFAVSGPLIVLAGFQARGSGAVPPPEVLLNMRMLYAFLPAAFLITAIVLLVRYPLSAKAMTDIRAQLETRRGTA
ncbi:MAG: MFS transporter [Opitutaceae bacterium]|nr:MFS transporter [Opitutaceae bacterium]